jgi:hypothetical protein
MLVTRFESMKQVVHPQLCISHLDRARNIATTRTCLEGRCSETSHETLDVQKTYRYGGTSHNECMHSSHNRPTSCDYNKRHDMQQKFNITGEHTMHGTVARLGGRTISRWIIDSMSDVRNWPQLDEPRSFIYTIINDWVL